MAALGYTPVVRDDRPSFTAAAVAFGRAVGLGPGRDRVARELLTGPFALALDALDRLPLPARLLSGVTRVATAGLVDHASLRMAAVDDAVREVLRDGIDQVVILGAGLDSRAYRMEELARATVFEVDHPATQAYKRARVASLEARAREVRFVPVDFARQSVGDVLPTVGHDASRPTLWVWEAVTMYLPHEAIASTLAEVRGASIAGSSLVMTYARPGALEVPVVSRVVHAVFDSFGEPILGAMEPHEAHAGLVSAGFTVLDDTGSGEWARRWGGSALLARPWASERLVHARVTER